MRRTTRNRSGGALAVALAILVTALVSAVATSASPIRSIPHSHDPDVVVLAIHHDRNAWGGEYRYGIDVTVYGDGRVVVGRAARFHGDDPKQTTYQVGERGIQRLLHMAEAAGLLTDTDYGNALVTDQGTTTVTVKAAGHTRTVSAYALLLEAGDHFLDGDQQDARRALREFCRDAIRPGVRY